MKQGMGKMPVNMSDSAIAKSSRLVGLRMWRFMSTMHTSVLVTMVKATSAGEMKPYTGIVRLQHRELSHPPLRFTRDAVNNVHAHGQWRHCV